MKVLVVTPWFPSTLKPGAGAFVARDADLLQERHEVTVLHLAEARDIHPDEPMRLMTASGITVVRQPFTPLNPASLMRAGRVIRDLLDDADVVHSMALHALMPVRVARPRIPWAHSEHWSGLVLDSLPVKKRLGLLLYRSTLARPDAVTAVGATLAASTQRYARREVRVIPNHVPLGSFDRLPEVPEDRGEGPLRLVAVGNLIHHKGPFPAVDAVGELQARGIPATLTWVGTGPLVEEVADRARQLDLGDAVHLPGQVESSRIPELLRQAHVFVLPTKSETFGISIAEALGQGLPVVTTGVGDHLGLVPPAASRVAAARTGPALADAIASLAADGGRWRPEQIMAYAHECFSEQRRRSAYASVYEELDGSRSARR